MLIIDSVRQDKGIHWYSEKNNSAAWSLVLMSYGKCIYWIEKERVVLEKRDVLLIPRRQSYYGKSIPSVTHEKFVVEFQQSGQSSLNLPVLSSPSFIKLRTNKYELLFDRLKLIYEQWSDKDPYYETMCHALLLEALTHWNREIDKGRQSSAKLKYAELMQNYIHNHFRQKITKDVLGEAIGKSPNYAAVLFREITGRTISEHVHAVRIKTAVYLLRYSLLSVGEISEYLGYCDSSYFHKVFMRITGDQPSEYLKQREQI